MMTQAEIDAFQWDGAVVVGTVSWSDDKDFHDSNAASFDFPSEYRARGNSSRALALRWVGDDARNVDMPAPTSVAFPAKEVQARDKLLEDWFALRWKEAA